tara:strand:- start:716 stop:973 length:258 start_codon:yes stop_codon:yes gene_type:complete
MNMIPEHVAGITYPMVYDIYVKKEYKGDLMDHYEDVMVIETKWEKSQSYENFDSYLVDLLGDLEDLKSQVENKMGHIDRVDIRSH